MKKKTKTKKESKEKIKLDKFGFPKLPRMPTPPKYEGD